MDYSNDIMELDCVEGCQMLPTASADIIIVDPPYNIKKDFGLNRDNLSLGEYVDWSKRWLQECQRILKPNGTMFIYGYPEILAHLSVLLPLAKQRWLQWHYINKNMPSVNFWQRSHESILCIWKDKPIFNRDEVREPYTRGFLAGSAGKTRAATRGRLSRENAGKTIYNAHEKGALPRDVINIPTLAGGAALKERLIYCKTCQTLVKPAGRSAHSGHSLIIHPTQKPRGVTRRLILSSMPGLPFNVLVPFCGSGSECRTVMEMGGKFTAFDNNPDFVLLARAAVAQIGINARAC